MERCRRILAWPIAAPTLPLLLLGAFAALAATPSAALAASPIAWSAPQLVDHQPPFSGNRTLSDIECQSPSLCFALDEDGNILSSTNPTGGVDDWTVVGVTPGMTIADISCPTASLCVAVGEAGKIFSSTDPTGDAGSWQAVETDPERFLEGVSCPSSSLCVAVDDDGNVWTSTDPTGDATTWHRASVAPGTIMRDVTCRSTTLCVAVGDGGMVLSTSVPATGKAVDWHQRDTDPELASGLNAVSCATAALCVAVGEGGNAIVSTEPTSSTAWSTLNIDLGTYLNAISCPSETFCAAVGGGGRMLVSDEPTEEASWGPLDPGSENWLGSISCPTTSFCIAGDNGGSFLTSTDPDGASPSWTAANVDGFNSLLGISCPTESLCVAVDGSGNVVSSSEPAEDGGPWAVAEIDPGNALRGISCPSPSFCAAIDDAGSVLTSADPDEGPAAWSSPVDIAGPEGLSAITCPSSSLCVAVDEIGRAFTSTNPDGGAGEWHGVSIAAGEYLESVFCHSASLCVAVDGAGRVISSSDPTGGAGQWHQTDVSSEGGLLAVTCPSAGLCVAVGSQGQIATSSNPGSAFPSWDLTTVDTEVLLTLDCPSTFLCVAVSGSGDVATSTDPLDGGSWELTNIGDFRAFAEDVRPISCPSTQLCLLGSSDGRIQRGTPATGSISGTVEDVATDEPLEGILVCAQDSLGDACETTDADGEYTISGLAPGNYWVQFAPPHSDSSYVAQYYDEKARPFEADPVTVAAGATTGEIDAGLEEGGRITGTVTDATTKAPVPNSLVCAYRASDEEFDRCTGTDGGGEYTIQGLATGEYKLHFSGPTTGVDYLEEYYEDQAWIQDADPVSATAGAATADIDVELEQSSRIKGTVTSAADATGVENVEVCVYEEKKAGEFVYNSCAFTDSGGDYALRGLRSGDYKVEFRTSGDLNYISEFYDDQASLGAANRIAVTAGTDTTGIDAELAVGGQVKGAVTEAGSGDPIPDVYICAYPTGGGELERCGFSDVDGRYTIFGLKSGSYKVKFSSIDYTEGVNGQNWVAQYYDGKASLEAGDPVAVTAGDETLGIDAEMHEGARIEGEVIDTVTKNAIQGVTVCAFKVGETTPERCSFSNSGGNYAITALPTGDYKVRFTEGIYEPRYITQYFDDKPTLASAETVAVTAGIDTTGVDAEMRKGGQMQGNVTAQSNGEPLEFIEACALEVDGKPVSCVWTDDNGDFTIKALEDGDYKVVFSPVLEEGFEEDEYATRYYDEKETLAEATLVPIALSGTVIGIDAQLLPLDGILPPVNTNPPEVSGSPEVGETLSCTQGAWSNDPTDYSFLWLRDGDPILGQTTDTYDVQEIDRTHLISCEVTASNDAGSTSEVSEALAIPAAEDQPPDDQGPGSGSNGGSSAAGSNLASAIGTAPGAPATSPPAKPLKCKKGFRKKRVKGRARCVKAKKKHSRSGKPPRR